MDFVNARTADNERDIEVLQMRLSITDQAIEEAMAELGLGNDASTSEAHKPEPRGEMRGQQLY